MKKMFIDADVKQVNFLDERFYTNDEGKNYFPSVTTILDVYPKGFGFSQWLKDVGNNAAEIADRAAEFGSRVHDITEHIHVSGKLEWLDESGKPKYDLDIWKAVLKYADFWKKCNPTLIENEKALCSAKLKFGGTIDRVVMIAGKRFLIDLKTSNYLHQTHELQLAAYAMLWNETFPDQPIEQTAILWLKANTRTDKIDHDKLIYQGMSKGGAWQLKTYENHYAKTFEIFKSVQHIWQVENPNYRPANENYPTEIII